jgi:hypothetical protein
MTPDPSTAVTIAGGGRPAEPFDAATATALMHEIQLAVEHKQLSPDHPRVRDAGGPVVAALRAEHMPALRAACAHMLAVVLALPRGKYTGWVLKPAGTPKPDGLY